jgi:phosphate:Na+ symporter
LNLINLLSLFGGIVLFLYGISPMSGALAKVAGSKMEHLLERLASNKYKGFLLGIVVTAIIQSSTAATVMVVGFVNAGVMQLSQTVGIILGANLGTTLTAQILRLGDIQSNHIVLQLLKPEGLAPVALLIGFILYMTGKRQKRREVGTVLIGFGILFIGMLTMSDAVRPLRDVVWFRELFIRFSNPFLGFLVGTVVTAIIQSSTASIGIFAGAQHNRADPVCVRRADYIGPERRHVFYYADFELRRK